MIIYAQTNDHLYNMIDIEKFEKSGDTDIVFYFTNGRVVVESYADSDTRDNVYNNLLTEFVKNVDA
jgi:uncharacterized protein YaiL (DUF2058 family)